MWTWPMAHRQHLAENLLRTTLNPFSTYAHLKTNIYFLANRVVLTS